MRNNFKISNGKVRLVTYLWKGLFETKILIKVVLTCDNYYRVLQKVYSPTSNSVMRKNFGKLCKKYSINLIGKDSGGLWLKKRKIQVG